MTSPPNGGTPPGPGLSDDEAHERLKRFGPNQPAGARANHPLVELFGLFTNPLALVLLGAAGVSAWLGDTTGAAIVGTIVVIGAAINFVQTYRSSRAILRLRAGVAVTATVCRDGQWREVPRQEVVPGDVIRLSAGDLVPADARLLTARDLHVQQAALTGESFPAEKEVGAATAGGRDPSPAKPGFTAAAPEGRDLSTAKPGFTAAPSSALKSSDTDAVFFGTSVVSGTATALVVATGPATAFGAIAARLAARPPETEFDRGTRRFGLFITQTVLVLVFFVFLTNTALQRDPFQSLLFAVALAVGLTPEFLPMITAVTLSAGAVRMARQQVVVKHLAAMQNLGSMDVLCSDKTGTLTKGEMELVTVTDPFGAESDRAFALGHVNSALETGIKSPLDAAVLRRPRPESAAWRKVDEVPFDFERRRLSVAADGPDGRVLITKGAPEGVLRCCSHFETAGTVSPLDDVARERITATCAALSASGHRLLAVAVKAAPDQEVFRVPDEVGLTLVGLLAFLDPPREDAGAAVRSLHDDGVMVKVLTGDNELVARHVCEQVGLEVGRVLLGDDIDGMTDSALGAVAETTTVFARLSPGQKNRVLIALKVRGHVVGFLGDGINDAPSLRAADVGITVSSAVDVAKDAAEVILMEPGLGALHCGILEGRRAFGNVMKYLFMGTSSNFGNMLSMAAAVAFLPFLPMLPVQILLNSLLYDAAQLAIPTDRVDPSFLLKPRRWDVALIRRLMLVLGPVSSLFDFLTFAVLLHLFRAGEALFHTGWFVESLATQTLVLFVIRTGGNPFRSRPSRPLALAVLAVVLAGVLLPYSPLAEPLGFVPLPTGYLAFVVGATAVYLVLVETVKRRVLGKAIG